MEIPDNVILGLPFPLVEESDSLIQQRVYCIKPGCSPGKTSVSDPPLFLQNFQLKVHSIFLDLTSVLPAEKSDQLFRGLLLKVLVSNPTETGLSLAKVSTKSLFRFFLQRSSWVFHQYKYQIPAFCLCLEFLHNKLSQIQQHE